MEPFVFILGPKGSVQKIQSQVEADSGYSFGVTRGEPVDALILDTFDGEIISRGRVLLQTDRSLLLVNLQSGKLIEQQVSSSWSFWSELKDGAVARAIKDVSRLRAFMPVTKLTMQRDLGLLLDDEGKTRARLHSLTLSRKKKSLVLGVTQSLRGYPRALEDLQNVLIEGGAKSVGNADTIYRTLGIKSKKEYSSKPATPLTYNDSIKKSITTIINAYLKVAGDNEAGVVADFDTEFLHDYRVSFRKVRSVLSLFKDVYSPGQTEELKQEFGDLMKQTNRLRDLDVYLLDKTTYFQLVPESCHGGLEIMFAAFLQERKDEHKKVSKVLKSKAYRQQIALWAGLFSDVSSLADGDDAGAQSKQYGAKMILKRYRKVCKIARSIDETTPDSVVHELRIQCKKLRYLMEFLSPLFAKKKVKSLVKSLKVLQDNLGRFNDFSVQQESLGLFMSEHRLVGKKGIKVAEAIGALTAMLYQLQCKERNMVMENFAHFDSETIRTSFSDLFCIEEN